MTSVVLGLPAYRGGTALVEAVKSLLDQTHRDFLLTVVADGPRTDLVGLASSISDPRLTVTRNAFRVGMIRNWNQVYAASRASAPDARYFAWVSDHDRWDPRWLASLVQALDEAPSAVLAYPLSERMHRGEAVAHSLWRFDTVGDTDAMHRLQACGSHMLAGDMIYGLFRLSALPIFNPFPACVYPDRLLIARLSVTGQFVQVPKLLWHRTAEEPSTTRRQRATLFSGLPPMSVKLPWWLVHAVGLRSHANLRSATRYGLQGATLSLRIRLGQARRLLARFGVA